MTWSYRPLASKTSQAGWSYLFSYLPSLSKTVNDESVGVQPDGILGADYPVGLRPGPVVLEGGEKDGGGVQ